MSCLLRACAKSLTALACFVCLCAGQQSLAQTQPVQAGQVIISELRLRGPAGVEDEFVEIYNTLNTEVVVQAVDQSSGWGVTASDGVVRCVVPNGTRIPARGHFLCANTDGYSLSGYPAGNNNIIVAARAVPAPFSTATPDAAFIDYNTDSQTDNGLDIPDGSGVALFLSATPTNQNAGTRLDAFGFSQSPALYREGAGWPTVPLSNREATFYRDLRNALPKDTNNNAADFLYVGTTPDITGSLLGAPGPENLSSPVLRFDIAINMLDPSQPAASPPNRERRPTVVPNGDLGTLNFRRTFTNNTGLPVTRLRFRIASLTTLGTPVSECGGAACADLRAITSTDSEAGVQGQVVIVRGVRLEEPPSQPNGGGNNSSLSADFITLGSPLLPGQSVNIIFTMGVMRTGNFRFLFNVEGLTGSPVVLD